MQIFVRVDSGQNLAMDVEPTDTVQNLESKIQDVTGVAPDLQTLAYHGTEMTVDRTLADYNIQMESTVNEFTYPDLGGFAQTSSAFSGGTQGADPGADGNPACFLKGTLIGTPEGEIPIEALQPGDWVFFLPMAKFRNGLRLPGLAQTKWVGHKHVPAYHAGAPLPPPSNRPVRVGQGAIDGESPHQDLFVTGRHQVVAQDRLAPAGTLVDDAAIAWQDPAGATDLFHLEFDSYGLVFANGLACETFMDVGNRGVFDPAEAVTSHNGP